MKMGTPGSGRDLKRSGDQPDPQEAALADRKDAFEARHELPTGIFDNLPVDAHRALLELAVGFRVAGGQACRQRSL